MTTQLITLTNLEWTRITNFGDSGTCWKKQGEFVVVCATDQEYLSVLPLSNTNVTIGKSKRVPLDKDSGEVLLLSADNVDMIFYGMVIGDDSAKIVVDSESVLSAAFVFEVKTTTPVDTFTLPLEATGTYDFIAYWGDGTFDIITVWNQAEITHTYAAPGTYIVKITGILYGWRFNNVGDKAKIYDIKSWGPLKFLNTASWFLGCINMTVSATDTPDASGISNFTTTFANTTSMISFPGLDSLNTSSGTVFYRAFLGSGINQPISFDTSSGTNMDAFFKNAFNFDQDMGSFDISAVTAGVNSSLGNFVVGTPQSTANYSLTLIGFNNQTHANNLNLGASATYNAAGAVARIALIADGWTITDGGPQSLGSELIVNGDFATDTDWTKIGGATISGGKLNINAVTVNVANQNIGSSPTGTLLHVVYTISNYVSGSHHAIVNGGSIPFKTGNGTFTHDVVSTGSAYIIIQHTGTGVANWSMDEISVKEIL